MKVVYVVSVVTPGGRLCYVCCPIGAFVGYFYVSVAEVFSFVIEGLLFVFLVGPGKS